MVTPNSALDVVMAREYERAAREQFLDPETERNFSPTVGFETEYSLVKSGGTELVTQEVRDQIVAHDSSLMSQELGAGQLEVKSQPLDLMESGFEGLEDHLIACEQGAVSAASEHDAELVRIGGYPLQSVHQIIRSNSQRYQQVVSWHNANRNKTVPTFIGALKRTHPTTAEIIALMNSVQFNLAMRSAKQGVKLLNLSFALLPSIIAISGNSRFVDKVDTKYSDTRMLLWEMTHDTRSTIERITNAPARVGLPNTYFADIQTYIKYVSGQPFIMNKPDTAFEVGTGLTWSDARLKIKDNRILLEFRPLSIQPSVQEDVALFAFYIGLIEYYLVNERILPPIQVVSTNRYNAMRYGLGAEFTQIDEDGTAFQVPAAEVIAADLNKAKIGLRMAGFEGGVERLEILDRRLQRMRAPSDDLADYVDRQQAAGLSYEEALISAVRARVVKSE
jgi:gamma-glutamylcysteine synthetase